MTSYKSPVPTIPPTHWLRAGARFAWFVQGYEYAAKDPALTRAMLDILPSDLYGIVVAILQGASIKVDKVGTA